MAREPYLGNAKNVFQISFGLVTVLFLAWLIFHTHQYIPEGDRAFWNGVFISYGVFMSIIYGNADIRNKLFNTPLRKFLPRFMLFFGVSLIAFYFILGFVDPLEHSLFGLLSTIPVWLAMIHAFVFATIESAIFQGFLDEKIGRPASAITAGIFHWGIWTGGAIVVIPSAALLFSGFSFINWYFRKDKNDLAPAIGSHTAFNFVKLGIILSTGGGVV
jgi:membrane protease YdiL (CAAX protease family)